GYNPALNQGARRLIMRRFGKEVRNNLIGVIFPHHFYRATFYVTIYEGITEVLAQEGYGLLTIQTSPSGEITLPPSIERGEVDAAIMLLGADRGEHVRSVLRQSMGFRNAPIISVDAALPGCAAVLVDAQAGAYAAAKYLFDIGHRYLLYLRRSDNSPFGFHQDQQYPGYQQACLDSGLDPAVHLRPLDMEPQLWRFTFVASNVQKFAMLNTIAPGLTSVGSSTQANLLRALRQTPEATAILAPNDPVAIVLRYHLVQAGIRVPDDISLIGFDDTDPLFDHHGRNMLTTVHLPLAALGRKAAHLAIAAQAAATPSQVVLPTKLVVRRSATAPGNSQGVPDPLEAPPEKQ
ncbi:MAG TPA: LacI family DNA-binding transcriptional regulator, partial [Armatimonadota bacterium]